MATVTSKRIKTVVLTRRQEAAVVGRINLFVTVEKYRGFAFFVVQKFDRSWDEINELLKDGVTLEQTLADYASEWDGLPEATKNKYVKMSGNHVDKLKIDVDFYLSDKLTDESFPMTEFGAMLHITTPTTPNVQITSLKNYIQCVLGGPSGIIRSRNHLQTLIDMWSQLTVKDKVSMAQRDPEASKILEIC